MWGARCERCRNEKSDDPEINPLTGGFLYSGIPKGSSHFASAYRASKFCCGPRTLFEHTSSFLMKIPFIRCPALKPRVPLQGSILGYISMCGLINIPGAQMTMSNVSYLVVEISCQGLSNQWSCHFHVHLPF